MKKLTDKQREHFIRRQKYQAKNLKRKNRAQQEFSTRQNRNIQKYSNLIAPEFFNLQLENCISVIKYMNKIKKAASRGFSIVVNLSTVKEIREGAIAMLLSVMKDLEKRKINIVGTIPLDPAAKKVLEDSEFFKFVERHEVKDSIKTKNILRTGIKGTSPNFLGLEIRKAMNTVWGVSGRNPLLHTVIFEMMRNSCDHAFENKKQVRWHLSISHDSLKNLTKYSFVDNGIGIIPTLKQSVLRRVIRIFTGNSDILNTAFTNGIESRTGLPWRGKGLPTIFENYNENYIKTLVVITDNVYLDFDKNIKEELPISFKGTYYYWEVDKSCNKVCFE